MFKKLLSCILALSVIIACLTTNVISAASENTFKLEAYAELFGKESLPQDLKDKGDLLNTLSFSSRIKWPSEEKLPKDFAPKKILEYGKNPGLGINELHKLGYTGKGVNVAYIDQPLLTNHVEYKDLNVRYYKIRPESLTADGSMHGPAVLSLLAGKDIGVAPESNVYFFGHPAWLMDQKTHAEALRKLIEVNKTLTPENKIRIVGFSDTADPTEKNVEEFKKAIKEAESSGIMVFDVTTINIVPLTILPYKDKDDPYNYERAPWAKHADITANSLCVPSSGRTTAVGQNSDPTEYMYWTDGGLSWTVPYIVGTIALGLQVDPTLTKENAIKYLKESAYTLGKGGIINPKGFVELVEKNCKNRTFEKKLGDTDYKYVLFNSNGVNSADMAAIRKYCDSFGDKKEMVLKDVAGYGSAAEIYKALKDDWLSRKGNLKGIQIIGTSSDVPAFDIHFKVQMPDSIDDSGSFKSDFFYSTFKNDGDIIGNDFSIYKNFKEKLNVSFIAEWPVMRLPLSKGEVAGFVNRYMDYSAKVIKLNNVPLVNFSNPIFPQQDHSDDMSYFIKERLDKEFSILKDTQYRLYGNKQGNYPVTTSVLGDFTKESIKAENEKGIADFFVNSHGQENNIDQAIFTTDDKNSEKRISFLNSKNINQFLAKNYYTLTTWTCLNAFGLGSDNLLHEALAKGKCINAMGATSIISNNGVNNKASFEAMKKNNFYYFQYVFFNSLADGYSRSESFFRSQRAYAQEILKNTGMLGDGNYQFNLHNVLSYHNLGLFESWNSKSNGLKAVGQSSKADNANFYITHITSKDIKVNSVQYEIAENDIQFTFSVESGKTRGYCLFNPPEGDVIRLLNYTEGINKGKTTLKLKVPIAKLKEVDSLSFKFLDNKDSQDYIFIDLKNLVY